MASGDFVLHDGPPYANGDLHLGHALNKILKDIINRFELIHNDKKIHYVPGWDCHGLPIEMKAVGNNAELSAVQTRQLCRELAESMIDKQRGQFSEFAIMTNLDEPYLTMTKEYETAQLNLFVKMLENGILSRQLKPVWWGCETQTALAEAELEYNANHKSVAIYVKFPLRDSWLTRQHGDLLLLIWTSTPWTIPANRAICVNERMEYTILTSSKGNVVVAADLVENVLALDAGYSPTGVVIKGTELVGREYENPSFCAKRGSRFESFPILHGDHVTATAGTGLVHNAPAHGMEDFVVAQKHKIAIASSVDEQGLYVPSQLPPGYTDLAEKYANSRKTISKILEKLKNSDMLVHTDKSYTHSYPYDWRLKTPVIQRATPQWFVDVAKIKATAAKALEDVEFVPEVGRNRLLLFVQNRSEWCISRQRVWGVPLPIIYAKGTRKPVLDERVVKHVVSRLAELGTDEWFVEEANVSRWVPDDLDGAQYYKLTDTMDVWFDSGTSWTTLSKDGSVPPPADIYLEGSDQHRGWFQLSLLNRIIASGNGRSFEAVAPYKKIITHGFTLDKKNDKMSKLKGNVILPQNVISGKPPVAAMGTDGLRLWVASSNYTLDVSVSQEVLLRVLEHVKKLRVTFKYMLGNLSDFLEKDRVDYDNLAPLDQWALSRLHQLETRVVEAYAAHNYAKVVRELNAHMSADLSALYFDICKDTLYTHGASSVRRRAVQTVLEQMLRTYIGLWAPVQPLLAQEVWELAHPEAGATPFAQNWAYFAAPAQLQNGAVEREFGAIWTLRDELYKHLEQLRLGGEFKNRLEAEVFLEPTGQAADLLARHEAYLDDYFLVSRVTLGPAPEGAHKFEMTLGEDKVAVTIVHLHSCKCPRCWKYVSELEDKLCSKCETVCK